MGAPCKTDQTTPLFIGDGTWLCTSPRPEMKVDNCCDIHSLHYPWAHPPRYAYGYWAQHTKVWEPLCWTLGVTRHHGSSWETGIGDITQLYRFEEATSLEISYMPSLFGETDESPASNKATYVGQAAYLCHCQPAGTSDALFVNIIVHREQKHIKPLALVPIDITPLLKLQSQIWTCAKLRLLRSRFLLILDSHLPKPLEEFHYDDMVRFSPQQLQYVLAVIDLSQHFILGKQPGKEYYFKCPKPLFVLGAERL